MLRICTSGCAAPARKTILMAGLQEQTTLKWMVPEEIPVAIIYNQRNYAVMLATPEQLDDFAVGFSLSEQIIEHQQEISSIEISLSTMGADIHINLSPEPLKRLDLQQKRRNLPGRSACGLCGLENADTFFLPLPQVSKIPIRLSPDALHTSMTQLEAHQPLNQHTRSVHAAAFARMDGTIQCAREDVGRHNALDKLFGAIIQSGIDRKNGFVIISSRCSYEIVEKAAQCGIKALASISAPTSFAVRKAKEANMTLYCRHGDSFLQVLEHLPDESG